MPVTVPLPWLLFELSSTAQDRGDVETRLGEACRRHSGITLLGLIWSVLLLTSARDLFWWFSPVLIGLVFSIPLSMWSSKVGPGRLARRWGLFVTPDESDPPTLLRRFHVELEQLSARPWAVSQDGLSWVLDDPHVRSVHLSLLPPPSDPEDPLREHHLEGLRLKARKSGESALLPKEKRELLWDIESIHTLSRTRSEPVQPGQNSSISG